ncbi:VOC family protein [Roseibium porphyridii]|uniref:VOC family protein n=1 Tax=Roseibium porphyridii TaxID=2866279 RepID=A0ABY8F7N1_9HYPH|nr:MULTISPECIES: VOC family protein [Stappiaceae]QFT29795.1 Glyoxalase/Bleomycin resistance protein/Dioxygenase superfamily protein [Labrenzia sp. THAF82]WFE90519.1 VOC family protein [Roseibium sp. KMA01]
MKQRIGALALLVPNYDQAITYYTENLGFELVEDTKLSETKRWVLIAPKGSSETRILLAEADGPDQQKTIGNQSGGRVFLFLNTDNFDRDHAAMQAAGVAFLEEPRTEPYGKVAVFEDLFGNKWDLIESY